MELSRFNHSDDRDMHAAENLTRHLNVSWGFGIQSSCGGTGALLFLSELDRAVCTSPGKAFEQIFTKQERIDRIISKMQREAVAINDRPLVSMLRQLVEAGDMILACVYFLVLVLCGLLSFAASPSERIRDQQNDDDVDVEESSIPDQVLPNMLRRFSVHDE
jgi:hypothetical protein